MTFQRPRIDIASNKGDVAALAQALTPVAKLCIKSGMGAGELTIAAKIASISVAAENARLGNRLNHSRIAAVTGLTRKEVRALSSLVKSGKVIAGRKIAKQRTTRVLHGWRTDPEFLDQYGNPLQLEVRGSGPTFHVLVRRYGGDVTPMSVLNELTRSGAVSRVSGGRVTIRKNTSRVKGFGSDAVAEIAARLQDLGTTLVDNIENAGDPVFVGFQEIPNLSADEAALFQATFSERAASLVDGVDRWRASQTRIRASTQRKPAGMASVGLGVFLVSKRAGVAAAPAKSRPRGKIARRRVKI